MTIKKPGVGNYWPTVYAIKDRLRAIQEQGGPNAVHSDRQTGKTTALIQFVAERTLILPYSDENKIAVVVPDQNFVRRFEDQFTANFPTLRQPLVFPASSDHLQGQKIHEVYAEEIFLIPCRRIAEIAEHFNFVAGVGTLQSIVSLNIKEW
jgi:hypothetical protein